MADAPAPQAGASLTDAIRWDDDGLVPAVVQQRDSGQVLMLAWMDREAVERTLASGAAHYYSRSRQAPWRKGESSGQTQRVVEIRLDCDGDALLLLVEQHGVACHTGRRSCWFHGVRDGRIVILTDPEVSPDALYGA
ncbi:MAG: phosphoribosyl-AMP cyclohydrolase [Proteobacteria bacterium]|nr:phosphoribosyl-AMP cyclohydrolase [Pseudomonadota bacterium]